MNGSHYMTEAELDRLIAAWRPEWLHAIDELVRRPPVLAPQKEEA